MMKCMVVDEADGVAPEIDGWKLACVSNAGLPAGKVRVTYLPDDAFVKPGSVAWRVRELMPCDIDGLLESVVESAVDLVALWDQQKISGLPRSERNAAIEQTRERLIHDVKHFLGEKTNVCEFVANLDQH